MRTVVKALGLVLLLPVLALAVMVLGVRAKYPPVVDLVRRTLRDRANPKALSSAGQPGDPQVADLRDGHDLVLERRGHLLDPSQFGFSQITVAPMPRPTHMAVRP